LKTLNYITYQTFPASTANSLQTISHLNHFSLKGWRVRLFFPLREVGSTDNVDELKDLRRAVLDQDLSSIFRLIGTNTKTRHLFNELRKAVLEKNLHSIFRVIQAIDGNENIDLIRYAMEYDFKEFLIMPPAYYKGNTEEGVFDFYSKLIKALPKMKIILYNFEKLSGYKFSAEAVIKLVKIFPNNIIGCKDSSYNLFEKLKLPNFLMFPGSEAKLLKGLELGCSGCISAVTNVTHSLARKVFDDFETKKIQTKNDQLINVRETFDQYNLISALHSFLATRDKNFKNVHTYFVPSEVENPIVPSKKENYKTYIEYPKVIGKKYDKILIDGRARQFCSEFCIPYLNEGGLVFFHDFWMNERGRYREVALKHYNEVASIVNSNQTLVILQPK